LLVSGSRGHENDSRAHAIETGGSRSGDRLRAHLARLIGALLSGAAEKKRARGQRADREGAGSTCKTTSRTSLGRVPIKPPAGVPVITPQNLGVGASVRRRNLRRPDR